MNHILIAKYGSGDQPVALVGSQNEAMDVIAYDLNDRERSGRPAPRQYVLWGLTVGGAYDIELTINARQFALGVRGRVMADDVAGCGVKAVAADAWSVMGDLGLIEIGASMSEDFVRGFESECVGVPHAV